MPMKRSTRTVWALVILAVAAFFVYVSLARRPGRQQPRDEFPTQTSPPAT